MNAIEKSFGFKPYALREVELTDVRNDTRIALSVPLWQICMQCGSCHASCSASGQKVNLRLAIVWLQKGMLAEAQKATEHCLFCGKCVFVCPRGLSTRHVVAAIHQPQS